jgi:hypothetical protein
MPHKHAAAFRDEQLYDLTEEQTKELSDAELKKLDERISSRCDDDAIFAENVTTLLDLMEQSEDIYNVEEATDAKVKEKVKGKLRAWIIQTGPPSNILYYVNDDDPVAIEEIKKEAYKGRTARQQVPYLREMGKSLWRYPKTVAAVYDGKELTVTCPTGRFNTHVENVSEENGRLVVIDDRKAMRKRIEENKKALDLAYKGTQDTANKEAQDKDSSGA